MKLLFSGGHLTPALAVIDYLQEHHPDVELYFAGRLYTKQDKSQIAPEKREVELRDIKFIPFRTGKLLFSNPITFISNLWYFMIGVFRALKIIQKVRPTVFMSFGGYVAVPLAIAAWIFKIPVVTHEQTRVAGFANRIISRFAKQVAVSFPETAEYFSTNKVVLTGNPIRKLVMDNDAKKPSWYKQSVGSKYPILYITGGSQGSEILNSTVYECLTELTRNWNVIHSCGPATRSRNYKGDLLRKRRQLSLAAQKRYYVREWCSEQDLGWIYNSASAMISRAGANTIQEIIMAKIPSILIPLPFSHAHEQELNARHLQEQDAAIIIQQKELSPEKLLETLYIVQKKRNKMQHALSEIAAQTVQEADMAVAELLIAQGT